MISTTCIWEWNISIPFPIVEATEISTTCIWEWNISTKWNRTCDEEISTTCIWEWNISTSSLPMSPRLISTTCIWEWNIRNYLFQLPEPLISITRNQEWNNTKTKATIDKWRTRITRQSLFGQKKRPEGLINHHGRMLKSKLRRWTSRLRLPVSTEMQIWLPYSHPLSL